MTHTVDPRDTTHIDPTDTTHIDPTDSPAQAVPHRGPMLSVLLVSGFVIAFSETLLNTALPDIMKETHVSTMTVQWLSTAYLLVAGIVMPLAAHLINRFKVRPLFTVSILIFLAGDLLSLFAPAFPLLLIGRIIMAVSVGIVLPLNQALVALVFPPEKRGLAFGLYGIVFSLGPALGPTVSGWIVDKWGWRVLFGMLAPATVLILILGLVFLTNLTQIQKTRLDLPSAILSCVGLGCLLYGFGRIGSEGRLTWRTGILLLVGSALTVCFCVRQNRISNPILRLRCFRSPSFRLAALLALVEGVSLLAPELVLPMYNQQVRGLTALVSGLSMLPGALMTAVVSPLAGTLYEQAGMRVVGISGYAIALVSTLPMLWFGPTTPVWMIVVTYLVCDSGLTMAYMQVTTYAVGALPLKDMVDGSTLIATIQQVASSLGTALLMTTMAIGTSHASASGASASAASAAGYHTAFVAVLVISALNLALALPLKKSTSPEYEA